MAPKVETVTAKIYDFPAARRVAAAVMHGGAKIAPSPMPVRHVRIEYGNCWYHEAAIAETDKPQKL
jgi:Protein of unknown function (DUF2735)